MCAQKDDLEVQAGDGLGGEAEVSYLPSLRPPTCSKSASHDPSALRVSLLHAAQSAEPQLLGPTPSPRPSPGSLLL